MTKRECLKRDGIYNKLPKVNLNDCVYYPINAIKCIDEYIDTTKKPLGVVKMFLVKAKRKEYLVRLYQSSSWNDDYLFMMYVDNLTDDEESYTYLYVNQQCTIDTRIIKDFYYMCKKQGDIKDTYNMFMLHGIALGKSSQKRYDNRSVFEVSRL